VKGKIWGSRGSIASPGQDTKRYGGNTSCLELRPPGCDVVILDAGTGIRELGVRLVREGAERMFLLLTHLHVDHLEGLGMVEPIWRKQTELHRWGPCALGSLARATDRTYFSPVSRSTVRGAGHDRVPRRVGVGWQIDGARFFSGDHHQPDGRLPHRVRGRRPRASPTTNPLGADLDRDRQVDSGFDRARGRP
jgi:ribonuclease BN (tRNA processing enzyme)